MGYVWEKYSGTICPCCTSHTTRMRSPVKVLSHNRDLFTVKKWALAQFHLAQWTWACQPGLMGDRRRRQKRVWCIFHLDWDSSYPSLCAITWLRVSPFLPKHRWSSKEMQANRSVTHLWVFLADWRSTPCSSACKWFEGLWLKTSPWPTCRGQDPSVGFHDKPEWSQED